MIYLFLMVFMCIVYFKVYYCLRVGYIRIIKLEGFWYVWNYLVDK